MIGRRKLIAGTAGGALFGLTGIALTRSDASIRFIGRRQTIIALLDTSTQRMLIVLGERDDDLLANIPGLTTVGNTRINLVIASHRILASHAAREHLGIDFTPTLSLQRTSDLPTIRGEITIVTDPLNLELRDGSSLHIDLSGSDTDHPDFLVTIRCHGNQFLLANTQSALRQNNVAHADILALPGSAEALKDSRISSSILVCNSRHESLEIAQVEVFATDPAIVRIGDGSITIRDDQFSS